jgi:NADH-quinone oxidoreductase subunit F
VTLVETRIITQRLHDRPDDSWTLDGALANGAYDVWRDVLRAGDRAAVQAHVQASGLRGRGGAGFPTAQKWSFLPADSYPRYLVVNGDEGEPSTFKDRMLVERDPHQLVEGIAISAYAIDCNLAFIYLRGEFALGYERLTRAIEDARAHGALGTNIFGSGFDLDIVVHRGAGAYICGEETALLESLEGERGMPRIRPPFPAIEGLYAKPTVVNNVETLSNVPHIINRGADWYKSIGPEKSPGPKLFCLSGHINKPGLYELPMGFPLKDLIYDVGGGILDGKALKGVIPGGSSFPVFTAEEAVKVNMDFDSVRAAGSLMGTAGVMVMHEDTCMVDALKTIAHFYHHESCGQCTPCREGCGWIEKLLIELEAGRGKMEDLKVMYDAAVNMEGNTICVLADSLSMPVKSFLPKYRDEFEAHIKLGRCPFKTASAQQAA